MHIVFKQITNLFKKWFSANYLCMAESQRITNSVNNFFERNIQYIYSGEAYDHLE